VDSAIEPMALTLGLQLRRCQSDFEINEHA